MWDCGFDVSVRLLSTLVGIFGFGSMLMGLLGVLLLGRSVFRSDLLLRMSSGVFIEFCWLFWFVLCSIVRSNLLMLLTWSMLMIDSCRLRSSRLRFVVSFVWWDLLL